MLQVSPGKISVK